MSVDTTADEKRDEVKKHVEQSLSLLKEIIVDEVWGYDDFSSDYKELLDECMAYLLKVKRRL